VSYRALFEKYFGINPHTAHITDLRECVGSHTSFGDADLLDAGACLDLLFAAVVEPGLGHERPVFVFDFPAVQASLAKVQTSRNGDEVAARCEVYVRGMELANGYQELTDPQEQRQRFVADNVKRRAAGLPEVPLDEKFLAALTNGLPDCAGVALGVDRLLMLRCGAGSLDEVLAFSSPRT
jgi:lysyl-tRNA synthetase class 2